MNNLDDAAQVLFGRPADALDPTERDVLTNSREGRILSSDRNLAFEQRQDLGDWISDAIARVGGSWAFIIAFLLFLAGWTIGNGILLGRDGFDPYPFIFLNLVLSMIAALQAPIIMMSQNRQAERDRFEASKDYEVNLKAEIELMALHHKIDARVAAELAALRGEIEALRTALSAPRP